MQSINVGDIVRIQGKYDDKPKGYGIVTATSPSGKQFTIHGGITKYSAEYSKKGHIWPADEVFSCKEE